MNDAANDLPEELIAEADVRELTEATVGDRIWFAADKKPYRVRARNERYIICTKPFNLKKTVLYTIVDLVEGVRGPDNRVFCFGYETDEGVAENMARLAAGEMEVSHRRRIPLDFAALGADQDA